MENIAKNVIMVSMETQQRDPRPRVVPVLVLEYALLTVLVLHVIWVTMVNQFVIDVLKDTKEFAAKDAKNLTQEIPW